MEKEADYLSRSEDTIAAISTPIGESGIGIIRISGNNAVKMADKVFRGAKFVAEMETHTVQYGHIVDPESGAVIDEVLLTLLKAPRTFSGEDTIEVSCHGGYLVLQKVLSLCLANGARLALPGEFTLRAFLKGRLDLAQAEAVVDLIKARSDSGLQLALRQLEGVLSQRISAARENLLNIVARVEAQIDFPEEDIPQDEKDFLISQIQDIMKEIDRLLESYQRGRILKEGISVVIAGKTNVGKSSLLNLLLDENRAIPGTTRDVISEYADFNGILVRLVDTAGFRVSQDIIEIEGLKRAELEIKKADLILLVLDSSQEISTEERLLVKKLHQNNFVVIINKIDLANQSNLERLEKEFVNKTVLKVSALTGVGKKELIQKILEQTTPARSENGVLLTNLRHKEALLASKTALDEASQALGQNANLEFTAIDLRRALDSLGEIIGKTFTEDILNRIFSQFCIGK